MDTDLARDIPAAGFNFDNCLRNAALIKDGFKPPKVVKTGTTIAGVIYKDGVVLGADTRATEGTIVSDKNCSKIHYLAKNMYCCGAGTAADTEMTTDLIASQLELHRLNTGRTVPVNAANMLLKQMLYRYQGFISAALVLGGVDKTGSYIYCIYPHGSTDKLPYASMGSGSLAAMSVFEARWKPELNEEDAKKLVRDAIAGGVFNDLGSGSNIDLCVIRKDSFEYLRNYELANKKGQRTLNYDFKSGTTAILESKISKIDITEQIIPTGVQPMETA